MSAMTPEQSRLCEVFFPVVKKYAAHFCGRLHVSDRESVESAMTDGMIRCIQRNESPDESLVKRSMWDAAIDWVRKEDMRTCEQIPGDVEYGKEPCETLVRTENSERLTVAMMDLTTLERDIVNRHAEGSSFRDIAKREDMDWGTVQNIYNTCVAKLRVACGAA